MIEASEQTKTLRRGFEAPAKNMCVRPANRLKLELQPSSTGYFGQSHVSILTMAPWHRVIRGGQTLTDTESDRLRVELGWLSPHLDRQLDASVGRQT